MQSFDLNRCPQCCSPSWLLNQINSSGVIASWHIVGDLVWDDRSQKTAYFEINYYVVSLETHRIGYVLSLNGRIFLLVLNVPSVAYNLSYYFITYKLDRYNIIRLYILYVIPRLAIFQLTIFHLVVGRPVATSGTTESCSSLAEVIPQKQPGRQEEQAGSQEEAPFIKEEVRKNILFIL